MSNESKALLRHKWDHNHPLHRFVVKSVYAAAKPLPFMWKYRLARKRRKGHLPYSVIDPGDTVIQVGAPRDLLDAGRSRAITFAMITGESGKVIVFEPDSESVDRLTEVRKMVPQIEIVRKGGWSEEGELKFYINDSHPASNFIAGTSDHVQGSQLDEYRVITVPVVSLDGQIGGFIDDVKLLSITTNGSELQILEGAREVLKKCHFVSLARTGEGFDEAMEGYGFEFHQCDDRGYLYRSANAG